MYMIIIKIDCCGRPQMLCGLSVWISSDTMRVKGLKEWGLESLGILQEDTMQQLLTGVISIFLIFSSHSNLLSCGFLPILLPWSF